jgi:ubiquinone/menaquinone biosynthesis C-methylase UbiE
MPTLQDNKAKFDGQYDWTNRGDEWSASWGGPFMQWYGTIFPRIRSHVPTNSILEIACGYGRWTQFLKDLCNNLIVIDLSEECINACKQRFSECSHIEYYVNDGKSLDMISDSSLDFVFSFDSLVHVDESVVDAYICQIYRILNSDGVAFIHHSNLGEYCTRYSIIRKIPKLEGVLKLIGILDSDLHSRDWSVDANKVAILTDGHGLRCISQEIILWGTKKTFIDCISTIVKNNSARASTNRILRNAKFMQEAQNLLQISQLYNPHESLAD